MKTLREYIKEAEESGVAMGHFNISNLEILHAIYNSAKKLNVPIIIGVSEGEEAFVGREEAVALIRVIRERDNYPIFLNADHHSGFESVKASIDAGFDAVIYDGAKLEFAENAKITKQCVDYAREVSQKTGRDILVEAELGYIGSGSDIKDAIPEGAGILTDVDDAKKFVEMTGIDLLAPSVGNIHGMVKGGNPKIDPELISKIRKETGVPLILHGGSGMHDDDFTNAIKAGIAVVHINTEIRVAYVQGLKQSLIHNPDEVVPYKVLKPTLVAVEEVVEERLKLFNGI